PVPDHAGARQRAPGAGRALRGLRLGRARAGRIRLAHVAGDRRDSLHAHGVRDDPSRRPREHGRAAAPARHQPASGPPRMSIEADKRAAAEFAAQLVEDGMRVGLGTGSTVAPLLPALAARGLTLRCVSTSPATEALAREVGLAVEPFDAFTDLDI